MATYGAMQIRIADELARTDLSDQIKKSILSAIEFYQDDRFWFNEGEYSFNTVNGTASYDMPVTFGEIDTATVLVSGNRYILDPTTYEEIRGSVLQTTLTGQPERYCIFEEKLWTDPIADGVYQITLSGLIYFTVLSGTDDTNAWTTEAEQLIRTHAKADLFAHVIRNDKEAQKMSVLTEVYWSKLMKKTVQKLGSGYLKPTRF